MQQLKQVGWLVWNFTNDASREFSRQPLTTADLNNGYRSEPVYIKNKVETPRCPLCGAHTN